MPVTLTQGYAVRPPTEDDIPAILRLMQTCDLIEGGETSEYSPDDVLGDWSQLDPATDAWVTHAPTGELVGYATLLNQGHGSLRADVYGHPDHRAQGIGTQVTRLIEERGRQLVSTAPDGARVVVYSGIQAPNTAGHELLRAEGYTVARHFLHMTTELAAPPPAPEWPEGVTVRACVPGQDERTIFETLEEAFQDHWGHVPRDYAQWTAQNVQRDDFDPSLWFLALQGDAPAGAIRCKVQPDMGWVSTLGVLRPWRRSGLGLALLRLAFGAFYTRGITRVDLAVDAESLTGATRLYERAGMQVLHAYAVYEKELRPGVDLSTQALA